MAQSRGVGKPKKKRANLAGKRASVSLHRNGLTIEVGDIPVSDAALVGGALLDAMRGLTKVYAELTVDMGTVGAGTGIEVPDEDGIESEADPISAKKPIGFTPC